MPKVDGSPTKGEVNAEHLRAVRAEVARLAQQLEEEREHLAEKSAAASLAEQIQALRRERQEEERERQQAKERGEAVPARVGRPSTFSEEEAATLCKWIADGKSLRSWCRQVGRDAGTVYGWMRERPEFAQQYAQAHADRTDTLADEILDIADGLSDCTDIAKVAAGKLRIETRKWIASKLKPSKWGDRQIIENTGTVTFQLGIGGKRTDPQVLDGKSLISEGIPVGLSDSQSDHLVLPPLKSPESRSLRSVGAGLPPSRGRAEPQSASDDPPIGPSAEGRGA